MFKLVAIARPDALALTEPGILLTYAELDKLTDDLAVFLRANDAVNGKVIGVYLEKCSQYIVACLAILKTGAAYLHLDLEYAPEIINKVLIDTDPVVIIYRKKYFDKFKNIKAKLIAIDDKTDWNSEDRSFINNPMSSKEAAFIGYSSGTTGMPKGVIVTHLAAVYSMSKFWEEVWSLKDVMNFGYATYLSWDAMSPLLFGATGHIIPDAINSDPLALAKYIKLNKINHIFFTPSLLKTLLQEVSTEILQKYLSDLNIIWVGGEVTTGELVEKVYGILPNVRLINNYGPSECFVVTQGKLIRSDAKMALCPAGHVLPEMEVLILDQEGQGVSNGLPGELYVTGPCLVDGYLNNSRLTKEKFMEISGKKYYKTGDLASFIADGRLIIHGRADFLVNINDQLVNLLEIQYNIKKALPIADCVVVGEERQDGSKYLVCYYVKAGNADWPGDMARIKESLSSVLPEDLIPEKFYELKRIPISNTSQKINYKQLHSLS